jgi:CheY-like chemotaxis protein
VLYPLSYGGSRCASSVHEGQGRVIRGVSVMDADDTAATEPGYGRRALVVDDSPAVRDLVVVNLELEGFEVRSAADGQEGLEAAAAWHPDVMTLDVVMPRLGGFEVLERLRADPSTADIPVVIVTGRAQGADRARGEALGVDAYLTKPFEPAELVAVVSELARTGRRYA